MKKTDAKKYEIDMCNGPLLKKILIFYFTVNIFINSLTVRILLT